MYFGNFHIKINSPFDLFQISYNLVLILISNIGKLVLLKHLSSPVSAFLATRFTNVLTSASTLHNCHFNVYVSTVEVIHCRMRWEDVDE
jgi:hypothetical protein